MVTDEAFILHKINYKNSSEIVKLLTKGNGRIDVVARGSRGPKSTFKGHLQAFIETSIAYQGRHNLKTLTHAEQSGLVGSPEYLNQVAMLYCNELLLLLNMDEEHSTAVYPTYGNLIKTLRTSQSVSLLLRHFELSLCALNGYALTVDKDLSDETSLVFQNDHGLVASHGHKNCDAGTFRRFVNGQNLSADEQVRINRLFRPVVNHLVGGREIRSRELLKT
jgi:DNA repair protein RecO